MAEPNCFDDDDEVTHLKSKLSSSCRSFSPFFCRIWGMQEFFFLPNILGFHDVCLSQNHKRRRKKTLSRRRLPLSMNQCIFPVFVSYKNPYNPSCPRIKRMICFLYVSQKDFSCIQESKGEFIIKKTLLLYLVHWWSVFSRINLRLTFFFLGFWLYKVSYPEVFPATKKFQNLPPADLDAQFMHYEMTKMLIFLRYHIKSREICHICIFLEGKE